jgi:AcrR family transcriptional regulator
MGRPRKKSDAELLAAAREVFLKHGVFGSTKEIARRAGVSEAALFKRFSTKAQLFMSAMAPPRPGIDSILEQAGAQKSPRKALQVIAEGVLDYFRVAIPLIMPLVNSPTFTASDFSGNFDTSAATGLADALTRFLRKEHSLGRLKAPNPAAAAGLLVSSMHSIALFELMGFHGGAVPPQGVRAMVDALWLGLEPGKITAKPKRKSP